MSKLGAVSVLTMALLASRGALADSLVNVKPYNELQSCGEDARPGCEYVAPQGVPESPASQQVQHFRAAYRGRLQDEAGSLAVLIKDGREQVVSVGDTLAGNWKVIAIGPEAVSLQRMVDGLHQRLWFGGGVGSDGSASGARASRVKWNAPSQVQPGSEFSVVLSLPGVAVKSGAITLEYDPAVLVVVDASGEWEDHQDGRAQLRIVDAGDGSDLAEVAFRVVGQQPSATRLRVDRVALVDVAGAQLSTPTDNDWWIEVANAGVRGTGPR